MAVTRQQMATLRAHLAGDEEEHRRLRETLDQGNRAGYLALLEAACFKAISRRFPADVDAGTVIKFVGDLRARLGDTEGQLDQRAAERLILAVLGRGSIDDLDDGTRFSTEIVLLTALVADEQLDDAGLDEFLKQARKIADSWII